MGQGQPRVIIGTCLVVLLYTMLHTKFQGHESIVCFIVTSSKYVHTRIRHFVTQAKTINRYQDSVILLCSMPICAIFGCSNRPGSQEGLRFFKLPGTITNQGEATQKNIGRKTKVIESCDQQERHYIRREMG